MTFITHILAARASVLFIRFESSSVFAITVYIVFMFASIQSVSLFTAFLYVSTLSAVIDEIYSIKMILKKICWFFFGSQISNEPTECSKLQRFSVIPSRFAAKY